MPTARCNLAVVALNGLIYAIGGTDTSGSTKYGNVEVYDPTADSWTTVSPLPTPRSSLVAGAVNGHIYAVGGSSASISAVDTNEIYDPSTNGWSTGASTLTARTSASGGVVNGLLYVVGRVDSGGTFLATNEAYNPSADSWAAATGMIVAESGAGVGVVKGILFAVGGGTSSNIAENQAFDPLFGCSPNLSLSTASLNFKSVTEGTNSAPRRVTLTNGSSSPITIAGSGISGPNAGDFSDDTSACPSVLEAGATCTISVTFSPTQSAGTEESATVTFVDNAGNNPQYIDLKGKSS